MAYLFDVTETRMMRRLREMSDADLCMVWRNLNNDYNPRGYYDKENGITMEEWEDAVYNELGMRDLPA